MLVTRINSRSVTGSFLACNRHELAYILVIYPKTLTILFKPVSVRMAPGCRIFFLACICCRIACNSLRQSSDALSAADRIMGIGEDVRELLAVEVEVDGVALRMPAIGVAVGEGLLSVGSALLLTTGMTRLPGILPCVVETVAGLFTMDPADTKPAPALALWMGLELLLSEP